MSTPIILTYADAVAHCRRFMEGRGNAGKAAIRGAIQQAYQSMSNARLPLERNWRIQLQGTQTTGTVVYDHTGGSSERLLTLTGATFPTDAADYAVRFNGVVCDIEQYIDTTTVTLDSVMNPGADVASTTYTLYPRWYALPNDFGSMTNPMAENWSVGSEVTMTRMLQLDRMHTTTGDIQNFAVGERPDTIGGKALFVWPPASSDATLDFLYTRQSRNLRHSGHESSDYTGTLTVTAGSASVTGNSTAFAATQVGAIIRFGTTSVRPDWEYGDNPYKEQRSIRAVNSADGAAAITLDAVASLGHTAVRYRITDPIDIYQEAHNAFWRYCEYHLAIARNLSNPEKKRRLAEDTLLDAMEACQPTKTDPMVDVTLSHIFPGTTADIADW